MHAFRTHTCAELTKDAVGQTVRLSGWVHRVRDHGGVLFIDLRDHYGMTQVLCDPDSPVFSQVEKVRSEWCIRIDGTVKARDESLINPKIPTGEIEVFIRDMEVLGTAEELPLPVFGDQEYPEETRLKYRFLDLRRESLHDNIMLRSKVVQSIRKRMWDIDFTEFQTPIITASSPEGARDFLVPSRLHPGKFYALPQAPQQFKQLIMVGGFDKYFQIAPCFRDEDPRADRSPTDFYQLDLEMSFVSQQDVFDTIQPVIAGIFEEFGGGRRVDTDWPLISYRDSALWYGTDKPDLRNPIKMQIVSDHFAGSGFAIFAKLLEQEGTEIRAIPAPGGGSRKFCDRMNKFAQEQGLPGMGYIFWRDQGQGMEAAGPLAKNIGPERTEAIRQQLGLQVGDAAFFLGGKPASFEAVAGRARTVIGEELGLIDQDRFAFAWIVDFPMYEKDDEGRIDFSHNPFSMPQGGMAALEGDPLEVLGYQYDLACNGYELVSGAIRNHKLDIMYKAFEIAGYGADEVEKRFGGMVNAFKYGPPPHGGCAAGIDRIVMLLADTANIREVIMFPMNQRAEDLMMNAPSEPTGEQLRDLSLRVIPQE
ncbi:aspartyl-tRNA synthetase [Dinoroseobacter shibae DFL 12 = DSM 16493]|jgi:aspartyl-tRNA synthetase|uniref:Aspartate--tRNA(Asp/Asn) ligase n=1 Tax=Dinoroseobacter shibae (strain DSM 16493 / NCIMB 14021 / DFL 12) TaxID=398580 RepID=SYDND_DINSH|nr:aspartate--tRNA ligase [Dinoroseobacter shibae]A8LI32.1 RecName: Full=Aspartate--tRNA(Asp/Asn) ligase; AltName: Full=Aspartyl-tRNA synthetase; Short=AspRS; AltName: Full=Non-discriminating aspartyl-tRNA synthetase; Short=ND-AspRS [Dinoroseobacter shibae DFL 12 = DSM 16493]ABV94366.1 aspartyl-tRNA synthetase [Dinoroseobacter shibae DFL 12 = DSM 16493]URF45796.1 aspartate--tRNA ligase [Dinoroseobacter shibae]URF50102.1 aspartate--tRNA ligase [Dinoroseobacter shibae]